MKQQVKDCRKPVHRRDAVTVLKSISKAASNNLPLSRDNDQSGDSTGRRRKKDNFGAVVHRLGR